jgi:hypothetical protein
MAVEDIVDMAGELTKYLRAQAALMTATGSRVYCDEFPAGTVAPYVLLRNVNIVPAAPPTLAYDVYTIQVDIYAPASQHATAGSIASLVRKALQNARGVRGTARVTSINVTTSLVGVDDTVSPALPRWVLTVDVTGRSN